MASLSPATTWQCSSMDHLWPLVVCRQERICTAWLVSGNMTVSLGVWRHHSTVLFSNHFISSSHICNANVTLYNSFHILWFSPLFSFKILAAIASVPANGGCHYFSRCYKFLSFLCFGCQWQLLCRTWWCVYRSRTSWLFRDRLGFLCRSFLCLTFLCLFLT